MSILGYKTIKLYKTKVTLGSSSEEYEADITDDKMQEIATAVGCNLLIITSGSKWLLYKGENTENGWLCQIASGYFEVRRYINNQATTGTSMGSNLMCRVQITNSSSIKRLVLNYATGKNGASLFKFASDEKIAVYGYISAGSYMLSLSDNTSASYNLSNVYGFADNLVLMSAIALKDKNAIIDGLYRCDINKNSDDHYVFVLDNKKYMASDGGTNCKWAIELDDSMLE